MFKLLWHSISNNTSLENLGLCCNQLSSLDVSNHPSLNRLLCQNNNLTIVKLADNKGVIIETFDNQALAGKNTTILVALQSLKAQAMAKVLVEEGSKLA